MNLFLTKIPTNISEASILTLYDLVSSSGDNKEIKQTTINFNWKEAALELVKSPSQSHSLTASQQSTNNQSSKGLWCFMFWQNLTKCPQSQYRASLDFYLFIYCWEMFWFSHEDISALWFDFHGDILFAVSR